jgi:hypothetical protein
LIKNLFVIPFQNITIYNYNIKQYELKIKISIILKKSRGREHEEKPAIFNAIGGSSYICDFKLYPDYGG